MSKELNLLATIFHVFDGGLIKKKKKIDIIFQKEKGYTFTLLIILIVKILQK